MRVSTIKKQQLRNNGETRTDDKEEMTKKLVKPVEGREGATCYLTILAIVFVATRHFGHRLLNKLQLYLFTVRPFTIEKIDKNNI